MSDYGHAIGVPPGHEPYEPYLPYGTSPDQPPAQDEVDLGTAHARARALAENGDLTGARSMIEEALAVGELRLGRDHAALVPLMVDLATIARRLGNLTEARNQLRRAYGVVVAIGGADHPTALSIEGRIAAVGYRLGEPTDAYDRHLADVGLRVLGAEHPAIRGALQRLGLTPPPAAVPAHSSPASPPPPSAADPPSVADPSSGADRSSGADPWSGADPSSGADSDPDAAPIPVAVLAPAQSEVAPVSPPPVPLPAVVERDLYGPALEGDIFVPARGDELTVRAPRRPNRRGTALVISLVTVMLVAGTIVALQLLSPGGGPTAPGPVSGQTPGTTTRPPARAPTGLTLTDRAGTVTLTWGDPSGGEVPFVVSGAAEGDELAVLETVPAGRTSATVLGTDPGVDYCFTVAAVWSATVILESAQACTERVPATPSTEAGPSTEASASAGASTPAQAG